MPRASTLALFDLLLTVSLLGCDPVVSEASTGAAAPTSDEDEPLDEDPQEESEGGTDTGEGSGTGDAELECTDDFLIPELPYAMIVTEESEAGLVTHLYLQSAPTDCNNPSLYTPAPQTRTRLTLPSPLVAGRMSLQEARAVNLRSGDGEPATPEVSTLTWLDGTLDLDTIGATEVQGRLRDTELQLHGCFRAVICDSR